MREAISVNNENGNLFSTLSDANIRKLQEANYLFHCALNGLGPVPSRYAIDGKIV